MATIGARELRAKLAVELTPKEGEELAGRLRKRVGGEALAKGAAQLVDELDVGWVAAAPNAKTPPMVVAELGHDFRLPMRPIGETGLFAAVTRLAEGSAVRWRLEVDAERTGGGQVETYAIH